MPETYTQIYALCFAAALVAALLSTPLFIRIAMSMGITDKPGERRVNVKVMPRFGGPAMFIGFMAAAALGARHISHLPGILAGGAIVFAVGAIDDIRGARALPKLGGQIIAAALAYYFGVRIEYVTNPFGGLLFLPQWLSVLITVLWIVAITNAVNLIDGLDGLAAGIVCIASMTFFLVAFQRGQVSSAIMAASLAGATGGFLRWNFYPAKIFMGDAGAYFLGYMAAVIAATGAFKSTTALTLLIPVFALGLPIFDTSFAILRRAHKGQPIMAEADKGHLHHRLLARGILHRTAVIYCYLITLLLSAVSLAIIREWKLAAALLLFVAAMTALLIAAGKVIKRKKVAGSL